MKHKGHKQNLCENDIHIKITHTYVVEAQAYDAKEEERRLNPGISNQ